jgi:diguanylate cyclase (GGDEF)-like protein
MAASEKMPFRNDLKKRFLCLLPMIVTAAALVAAYISDPYFWISENGELNGLYYVFYFIPPGVYLLASFICSLINAKKTEIKEEKRLCRLIAFIPIGVILFGMFQRFVINTPTFCFGCTVMLLVFYMTNIRSLISVDELTRLNNRGMINRYMEQVHYKENSRVFAMMIDIDRFKHINDTYGHAEGDRALIITAETLRQTCERFKAKVFLGRYGGDEFTAIIHDPGENESPEQMAEAVKAALAEKKVENGLPYALEISYGYDELRSREDTMRDCLVRADEKLYEEKRKLPGKR